MKAASSVLTRGLICPPLRLPGRAFQLCFYIDRCCGGFGAAGPWRFWEPLSWGWVDTIGLDIGSHRFRIALEKLRPGVRCEWGLC